MSAGLNRAAQLGAGRGQIDLYAFARPEAMGLGADVTARLSSRLTAFGTAFGGWDTENGDRLTWGALGGLRASW